MHFCTKSWSKMVVSWRYADLSMEWSRDVCVANASSVAIDDLVITTPLKNDITALWRFSGKAGASLLGQDVVASLLSLCMAKWPCKWRRCWLYVRSNTKNAKSLLINFVQRPSGITTVFEGSLDSLFFLLSVLLFGDSVVFPVHKSADNAQVLV